MKKIALSALKESKRATIGALLGLGIAFVGQYAYYRYLPGSYFLPLTVEIQGSYVGEPVTFTLCRESKIGAIKAEGIRTIINLESPSSATEYTFPFTIEDRGCVDLPISLDRQPQEPGTYKMTTNVFFKVHGHDKQVSYSDTYSYSIKE